MVTKEMKGKLQYLEDVSVDRVCNKSQKAWKDPSRVLERGRRHRIETLKTGMCVLTDRKSIADEFMY